MLGPLEAIENSSLSIVCEVLIGGAEHFILREGGVVSQESRIRVEASNHTHKEFILSPVSRKDTGRSFTCDISELSSGIPSILTVYCKKGHKSHFF